MKKIVKTLVEKNDCGLWTLTRIKTMSCGFIPGSMGSVLSDISRDGDINHLTSMADARGHFKVEG